LAWRVPITCNQLIGTNSGDRVPNKPRSHHGAPCTFHSAIRNRRRCSFAALTAHAEGTMPLSLHLVLLTAIWAPSSTLAQIALPSPPFLPPGATPSNSSNSTALPNPQWTNLLGDLLWFYEAQRSGYLPPSNDSNRVSWRNNSALEDVPVGGYYDAGGSFISLHVSCGLLNSLTFCLHYRLPQVHVSARTRGRFACVERCLAHQFYPIVFHSDLNMLGRPELRSRLVRLRQSLAVSYVKLWRPFNISIQNRL